MLHYFAIILVLKKKNIATLIDFDLGKFKRNFVVIRIYLSSIGTVLIKTRNSTLLNHEPIPTKGRKLSS